MGTRRFFLVKAILLGGGVSVFLFLALAAWRFWRDADHPSGDQGAVPPQVGIQPAPTPLQWSDLESEDYLEWIANLREFGCPDPIIQQIVWSDLKGEMKRRMDAVWTPARDMAYWKTGGKSLEGLIPEEPIQQALDGIRREYQEALAILFPDLPELDEAEAENWAHSWKTALGFLPETKRKEFLAQEREWSRRFLAQTWGRDPFGGDLTSDETRLDRERERYIRDHFSEEEQLEYRLRFSPEAQVMRWDLAGFEPDPDEFRKLFGFFSQSRALLGLKSEGWQQPGLEGKLAELKTILGEERFEAFWQSKQPGFREFFLEIEPLNFPLQQVFGVYEVYRVIAEELIHLKEDAGRETEELNRVLFRLKQETFTELRRILGNDGFERYYASRQGKWLGRAFASRLE